ILRLHVRVLRVLERRVAPGLPVRPTLFASPPSLDHSAWTPACFPIDFAHEHVSAHGCGRRAATSTARHSGGSVMTAIARRRLVCAAIGAALAASALHAATDPKVTFTDTRLKNGLRVIVAEDHTAPVFSIAVNYDVGSRN